MEVLRRRFISTVFALGAALTVSGSALAQTPGKDFVPVNPAQATEDAGKIEVLEFFSYGCPHCADFSPLLSAWIARQGGDVVVKKVPITFGRAAWGNIAKLYYALEITGDLKRLEPEIFTAIHKDKANLFEERALTDWVAAKGVDRKKFTDAFASFGVMSKVRRGDQLAGAYKITGVPALAVDGRFMITANTFEEQLSTADKLIARIRSEKAGKK